MYDFSHNQGNSNMLHSSYSSKPVSNEPEGEKQKRRTIKKILLMSTLDQKIQKILLKILQQGQQALVDDTRKELTTYAQTILDKEKQQQLDSLMDQLFGGTGGDQQAHIEGQYNNDVFLNIVKHFVLSPVEKLYITKIEAEIQESERLDQEITQVQKQINEEKEKKLQKYKEEKLGKIKPANKETCEALIGEIQIHENKLEKANQKLNSIVAHNNQLREKINQLRKEKNVIENIYNKLKNELEEKKQNVERTIKEAGEAYYNRNRAEEELKALQEKAEQQKQEFEKEYKDLNKNIQYDRRFKEFIKNKQKEKDVLANLEKQIKKNQEIIAEKMASNQAIDDEYEQSAKKEEEIKQAFEKLKKETGINETKENETKELLNVFINLYQKNTIMSKFVKELTQEVDELDRQIEEKKKEIQMYSTKGATSDNQKRELKIQLMSKIQQEENKKAVLKAQYEKSIETISLIKGYLENVFTAIEIDPEIIEKLRNSAITEENMIYFLGILEQKGIDSISEYSRLIAEQLKLEKGDVPGVQQQIDDLNNIIAYENANIMNYYSQAHQNKQDCPDDVLFQKEEEQEKIDSDMQNKWMSQEELRKAALETLNKKFLTNPQTEKKQVKGQKKQAQKQKQQQQNSQQSQQGKN